MKSIYTAKVDGHHAHVDSGDGQLDVSVGLPTEMGGDGVSGTNPEQLFAAAYVACFTGALGMVAGKQGITLQAPPHATCTCALVKAPEGPGYIFDVALSVEIPGVEPDVRDALVSAADALCPVSNTLRGHSRVAVTHH